MTYFFFSGKDVVTYNDKISIQYPFKTDFNAFVKANDLFKIVSKMSAKELSLNMKGDKFILKSKKVQASLATITDDEISVRISNITKALKKVKWEDLPGNFIESISLCAFAASKSESDQTLTCIKIDGNDCLACDNQRVAHAILESPMKEMFLKASELDSLKNIAPVQYSISKSWIHFKNEEGCIFSIRKMEGKYPDVASLFLFDGTEIKFPKDILEGTDIASVFADETTPIVNIKIADKVCYVEIESDAGTLKYRSKVKYDSEPLNFSINPEFLKEMIGHSSKAILTDDKVRLESGDFALVTCLYA